MIDNTIMNHEVSNKLKEFLKDQLEEIKDPKDREILFRYCQILQTELCEQMIDIRFLRSLIKLLGGDQEAHFKLLEIRIRIMRFVLENAERELDEARKEFR